MTCVSELRLTARPSIAPCSATLPQRSRCALSALVRAALPALLLVMSAAAAAGAGPLESTRVTLENGMRVVLASDSLATALDVSLWFPAGTRHEKPAQAGLAQLAARVAFRAGADDPLAGITARGGSGGMLVTPDLTTFSATVAPAGLGDALAFLDSRTSNSVTTPGVLAADRGAMRAERSRLDRSPVARGIARLWAAAWPGHPYASTGAVPPASLESLTSADVDGWRRMQLAPAGGVLVLSGAFDRDSALVSVRRYFGGRPRVRATTAAVSAPRTALRTTERLEVPLRLCMMGWRGPGAGDPDAAAFELLAAWLGGSSEARLSRSLVTDWKVAIAAQAGFAAQKDGSLLWSFAAAAPDADSSAVETTLLDAATAAVRKAPESFELERTRRQLESSLLFALQTARQRAQSLGEAELLTGDASTAARRLEALRKVTPADVQRAAARLMTEPNRAVVWILPSNSGGAR